MDHRRGARASLSSLAALLLLVLAACTTTLVPAYDAGLADGLVDANRQALLLFAHDEDDLTAAGYPARADEYAHAVSAFEELQARAAARPLPPLSARLLETGFFRRVCPGPGDPEACLNASPASMAAVVETLGRLRIEHRAGRLDPATLALFKGQYTTAVRQALTVEAALKR